ncbi:MAG: nuclear transport factor 2 family protein [Chitinophagales bacterium]
MKAVEEQIIEIVNRETRAWDTQDVELLLTIFHPDMVWPWPKNPQSHDPVDWIMDQGRYNYERWKRGWQELFDTQRLVHNNREIVKIALSNEEDGALAVVDIDTLWIDSAGNRNHWKGRVGKVYSLVEGEWKMTMHIGVLDYSK